MDDTEEDSGNLPALRPDSAVAEHPVILLRGAPVMLDAHVAAAFGVDTREVNQAVTRNPHKFDERHTFQVTDSERYFLTSQGVISKPGRGGSRALPRVYTQKGVARLATVIDTPRARDATDLMIDIFIEVYQQIERGKTEISVSRPERLLGPAHEDQELRKSLLGAIKDLMAVRIPRTQTTVGDEIGDVATGAMSYLKAHLNAKALDNDKVAAETLLVLEKAREIRDRTRVDVAKSEAEIERVHLDNFEKKLNLVERLRAMEAELAPNAIVRLHHNFVRPPLLLQAPPAPGEAPEGKD